MHAYVAYRAAVDFSRQRVTVYSLPFASMLASLCLDGSLAQAVADACLAGFDGAWDAFLAAVARLEATDCGQARWDHLHIAAGQLGLLLAARWPQQALTRLAQSMLSAVATERLGVSLLHRRDMTATVRSLTTAPEHARLREAVLHHLPEAAIDAHNAEAVAQEVTQWQCRFKRAKDYLLAHHAERLTSGQRRRLVEQMSLVPYGITAEGEKAIQQVLNRAETAERGRFSLADVDPIAIISAIRTKTL